MKWKEWIYHSGKRSVSLLLMGAAMIFLNGCGTYNAGFTFYEDGTITMTEDISVTQQARNFLGDELTKKMKEDRNNGMDITSKTDGYTASKGIADIQELVDGNSTIWNSTTNGGVRRRKGILYDTYSLHLHMDKQSDASPDLSSGANDVFGQMASQLIQNTMETAKINFTINVPFAVDNSNAGIVSGDKQSMTWDLKPAVFGKHDVDIDTDFRIYHKNNLIALGAVGVIMILLAGTLLLLVVVGKIQPQKKKKFIVVIGVLFTVVCVSGIFVKFKIDHPPILTETDMLRSVNKIATTSKQPAVQQKAKEKTSQPVKDQQKDVNPSGMAEQVFQNYHKAITDRRYHDAYQLMSPRLQQDIGSEHDYTAGYVNTISSTVSDINVVSSDPNKVILTYNLKARDREENGIKVQTFQGSATFLNKGAWRIDEMSAKKTGEYME